MIDWLTSFPVLFLKIAVHAIPFFIIAAVAFQYLPFSSTEVRGPLALVMAGAAVLLGRWGVQALWRHLWKEDTWYRN